jgi:hypothetical protein
MIFIENFCIQFSEVDSMKSAMDLVVKLIHFCANDFNYCQCMEVIKTIGNNSYHTLCQYFMAELWRIL